MQALCTRNVGISGNVSKDNDSEERTESEMVCAGVHVRGGCEEALAPPPAQEAAGRGTPLQPGHC